MGALTNLYVAATSGSDGTGNGTSGNPYKTTQFALDNHGLDATNGNYVNLSGDDVLSATLNFSTWGAPSLTAPTVIGNWSGGPDGQGGLNGNNGNFSISDGLTNYVSVHGLKLHNTGTAVIWLLNYKSEVRDCEVYDNSNQYSLETYNLYNLILGCNIYNCGTVSLANSSNTIASCYLFDGPTNNFASAFNAAILAGAHLASVAGNIIVLKASSSVRGIYVYANSHIEHNSILSLGGGTGIGIFEEGYGAARIANNLIEGFSGAGGKGIETNSAANVRSVEANAVYNCTTAYSLNDVNFTNDNETLSATPFAKSGSNTFANRFTYLAPVDTGNVWGKAASGAYPVGSGLDKGAVQHAAAAAHGHAHYNLGI